MKNRKKLSLDKLKIARLNNPQNIIGGFNTGTIPPPTRTSLDCPTDPFGTSHSTKTKAMGSDI
ncbi:hypothetical protein [Aquimarina sp. 2201CG14-23]|uniref:hypothetical protein n=1 Tax=Aquimarina mycalae TaxID=3040073 RepID=UPI002477E501|nr:hypothetical protein [Aquimarina sp. 2201CG14-23]MDH7448210.1 hypothetical protein [Aquimarina sp. 2201CG14-23]